MFKKCYKCTHTTNPSKYVLKGWGGHQIQFIYDRSCLVVYLIGLHGI